MDNLKELLTEYRDTTLEISTSIEKEDYPKIHKLLDDRQSIIDALNSMEYDGEGFKNICDELNILKLQRKADYDIKSKRTELIRDMNSIKAGRNANAGYSKKSYVDSIFFSRKV